MLCFHSFYVLYLSILKMFIRLLGFQQSVLNDRRFDFYFVEVGYLLYLFCKAFEFTFNMKSLRTLISLTITEGGFAVLDTECS